MKLRIWWETFLGLLYPTEASCLVCSGPVHFRRPLKPSPSSASFSEDLPSADVASPKETLLCPSCRLRLSPIEPPYCLLCGRHLEHGNLNLAAQQELPILCNECKRLTSFQRARSYGAYRDELRDLLHRYKFARERELLPLLASFLFEAWDLHMAHLPCDILVPVPIHPNRLRERGFNQAHELAQELSHYSKIPLVPALIREVHLKGQAMKGRRERQLALEKVFSINPLYQAKLSGATVLLIDDIYTTGSTAEACSRVLVENGAQVVYVLTVAR